MTLVNEGLKAGDLEGVVEKRFSVDQFKSKMGDDKNILVLSFVVDGQAPARDLERFAGTRKFIGYSNLYPQFVCEVKFNLFTSSPAWA